MWILVHLAMVWPPIEMKKMNCKGHVLVVSKNQESRATANDNPNYRVLFRMEKDVGTRVIRSICNKKYYYYIKTMMSPPKNVQNGLKLLTIVSPYRPKGKGLESCFIYNYSIIIDFGIKLEFSSISHHGRYWNLLFIVLDSS
jgi:hypothetical protein